MNKLAVFVLILVFWGYSQAELSDSINKDSSANRFIDPDFISVDSMKRIISGLRIVQYDFGKKDPRWHILEATDYWKYSPHPINDTLALGENIYKELGWFHKKPAGIDDDILLEIFIRRSFFENSILIFKGMDSLKYSGNIFKPREEYRIMNRNLRFNEEEHDYIPNTYNCVFRPFSKILAWYFWMYYLYVFIHFLFYALSPTIKDVGKINAEYVRRGIYAFGILLSVFLAFIESRMTIPFSWFDFVSVLVILLSCLFLSYLLENNEYMAHQEVLEKALIFSPAFFVCHMMGISQALLFLALGLIFASPGIFLCLFRDKKTLPVQVDRKD